MKPVTRVFGVVADENESFITEAVPKGACDVLCSALTANIKDRDNELETLHVLNTFADNPNANVALVKNNAAEPVISAMKAHPKDEPVVTVCMEILLKLASADSSGHNATMAGSIPMIMSSLIEFEQVDDIQENGMKALQAIVNDANAGEMLELDVLEIVDNTLGQHVQNEQVAGACDALVESLAPYQMQEADIIDMDKQLEGQSMPLVMEESPEDPEKGAEVTEQACKALGDLAESSNDVEPIVKKGAIDSLIEALTKYPQHPGVVSEASRALGKIAESDPKYVDTL